MKIVEDKNQNDLPDITKFGSKEPKTPKIHVLWQYLISKMLTSSMAETFTWQRFAKVNKINNRFTNFKLNFEKKTSLLHFFI